MMKWVAGLVGAVMLAGCSHLPKMKDEANENRRLAYIDAVRAPLHVKVGTRVDVEIDASMPDPSWQLLSIHTDRDGQTIRMSPWLIRTHDKPAIQVLVPFSRKVPLIDLGPGTWTVEVLGYDDAKETVTFEVTP